MSATVQQIWAVRHQAHAPVQAQSPARSEADCGRGPHQGASAPGTPQHAARGPAPDPTGPGSVAAEVAALRGRLAQLGTDLRGLGPGADATRPPENPRKALEAAPGAHAPAAPGEVAELQARLGELERRLEEEAAARRAAEQRVRELEALLEARRSERDAMVDAAAKACYAPACLLYERKCITHTAVFAQQYCTAR